MLKKEEKSSIIQGFQVHKQDSGSVSVQVALLTEGIKKLTGHLQGNRKDFHSRRGLIKMVSKRKRLLEFSKRNDKPVYEQLIKTLGLRG